MKNIILIVGIILLYTGCKDMDEPYKDYIVPNGIVYPGKAGVSVVLAGKKRAVVAWAKGTDANVVKASIHWNNFTDSVVLDIPETGEVVSYLISPLEESSYSFIIYTYDRYGNKSVPTEVNGSVYGDIYQSRLIGRNAEKADYDENGNLYIQWGPADVTNGALETEVRYKNTGGDSVTVVVPANETETLIDHYEDGTDIRMRTIFIPEPSCIDTFYTKYISKSTLSLPMLINRSDWTATASSQQNNTTVPQNAIDGNLGTPWHSLPTLQYPHWIAFDMKKVVNVAEIVLNMRSANPTNTFKNFTVQGSMDGTTWTDYGNFVFQPVALIDQAFTIDGRPAMRHIRIYARDSHVNPYAVLAEFNVWGTIEDQP